MNDLTESRITVSTEELAKDIAIWLTVLGQRRPAILRDLWTRRGEALDRAKIEHARNELARYLADRMQISGKHVTRRQTSADRNWDAVAGREE